MAEAWKEGEFLNILKLSDVELQAIRMRAGLRWGCDENSDLGAKAAQADVMALLEALRDEGTAANELLEIGTDLSEKMERIEARAAQLREAFRKAGKHLHLGAEDSECPMCGTNWPAEGEADDTPEKPLDRET